MLTSCTSSDTALLKRDLSRHLIDECQYLRAHRVKSDAFSCSAQRYNFDSHWNGLIQETPIDLQSHQVILIKFTKACCHEELIR